MARTENLSKKQIQQLNNNFNNKIDVYREAILKLSNDLDELQDGDGSTSYWSGKSAYSCIKELLNFLSNNKALLKKLEESSTNFNVDICSTKK